jgi:hypothetical protein
MSRKLALPAVALAALGIAAAPASAAPERVLGSLPGATGSTLKSTTTALGQAVPGAAGSLAAGDVGATVKAVEHAVATITPGGDCDQQLSKPFARWGDPMRYTLVPGGDFEGALDGWTLKGGATVIDDNEPWKVTAATDSRALHLPAGSSAVTPPLCAGLTHPTARLFAKGGKVPGLAGARVDILYPNEDGILAGATLGVVMPSRDWQPTHQILTASGLPLLTGGTLALRITAQGAPVTIDDVYVDPFRR